MPHEIRECDPETCQGYGPGHQMHFIHAGVVSRSPEQWRDAVVTATDGLAITVSYVRGAGNAEIWHHKKLKLRAGEPVTVHEATHALQVGTNVVNVAIVSGVGPVPEGTITDRKPGELIVVNLATGKGKTA